MQVRGQLLSLFQVMQPAVHIAQKMGLGKPQCGSCVGVLGLKLQGSISMVQRQL